MPKLPNSISFSSTVPLRWIILKENTSKKQILGGTLVFVLTILATAVLSSYVFNLCMRGIFGKYSSFPSKCVKVLISVVVYDGYIHNIIAKINKYFFAEFPRPICIF